MSLLKKIGQSCRRKKIVKFLLVEDGSIELPECYYLPFPKDMTAVGIMVKAKLVENIDGEWKIFLNLTLINDEDICEQEIEDDKA